MWRSIYATHCVKLVLDRTVARRQIGPLTLSDYIHAKPF